MISDIDASRIAGIGMATEKIKVLGNAKYDALAAMASPALHEEIAGRLRVQDHEKFFVAGSTHPGEEDAVIEAYKKLLARYPEFRLILVPRHIERTGNVIGVLHQSGLDDIITFTEIRKGRPRSE